MRNPGGVHVVAVSIWFALAIDFGGSAQALAADPAPPVRSLIERRHQNVVLQQWELSCAAAALATILRYQHGVPVTERSVALGLINRDEYVANPDLVRLRQGFSLLDLKRFADALGYEAIGLGQLAFPDLLERAPIIVPVSLRGYPHFVVFRGATAGTVLLADPAFGNVTMPIDKFVNGWIDYRDIGRVGFVVTKSGTLAPPGRLAARASDFVVLRSAR
jgi:uncharacterized protein